MVSRATNLVCDNAVLQGHALYAKYHRALYVISLKDYKHDTYFQSRPEIEGIDIDQFEVDRSIADRDMTMDAMVGVADYSNNRAVNNRMVLLELRMDYDSTKHLRHKKLLGKINHSRAAIGTAVRVDEENVFVFRKDVAEEAKKWMFATSQEYPDAKGWVALSPEELENLLQSQASMPYQAITNMASVDKDLGSKIAAKDFDAVLEIVDYWHCQAEQYKLRYQLKEEQHIKNHLHDTWQKSKAGINKISSSEQVYIDYLEDEYSYLR
ncbi:MAG: hypothetical protein IKO73_05645 [Bacteroidaceae bacterium]|nr:hypothetical protein [Bacteroidaceae bacterium]